MKELQKVENKFGLIDEYCELTSTSLSFTRDITENEWQQVYNSLSVMDKCVHFWIGDCLSYYEQKWGMYDDMIEQTGFSKNTLQHDKYIAKQIEPCRRRQDLSFAHHIEVASLESDKQDYWLDKAENENLTRNQLRNELNKKQHEEKRNEPLPEGKYRVIYADPPWSFKNSGVNIAAEKQYPTMTQEEICNLSVQELCENTTILFLWSVASQLPEAIEVAKSWGFPEIKTSMIWVKNKSSFGGWWEKTRHEILLICTKSETPQPAIKVDSVIEADVSRHSKKPEIVYGLIEQMYPTGPYIELFARNKRQNWEVYSNEQLNVE